MTAVTSRPTSTMYVLCRTVTAAAALSLVSGCAPNAPPDSQAEKREPAEPASHEPALEANGTEDEAEPAAQAKGEGEQRNSDENTTKAASAAKDDKDEAEWSPESAATVIERARSRLKRRCDRGSQPACAAIPNLDKCVDLRRASCASLGELFAKGAGGVDRSPEHARDFWWRACDIAPADCVRYGKLLFQFEDLDSREAVAERFFKHGCTNNYQLCESVGRFYQQKNELAAAQKFFDLGCAGGQQGACRAKK